MILRYDIKSFRKIAKAKFPFALFAYADSPWNTAAIGTLDERKVKDWIEEFNLKTKEKSCR